MIKKVDTYQIFDGTKTAIWINSQRHFEANAFQAKITNQKEEIDLCGEFMTKPMVMGGKGTGSIGLYKTDSSNIELFDAEHPNAQSEIVYYAGAPNGDGERIRLTGVTFDETTLADYQAKKAGQVTIPFTFTDYKVLERVEASI